jgi:hypothetical protein
MYKVNYTQESFEEVLQQAYDELEPEDIKSLLLEAKNYYTKLDTGNQFIAGICNNVVKQRSISFKQWKAISAYVNTIKKKERNKNNKTF